MSKTLEQILTEQVQTLSRQQAISGREGKQPAFWPIITISREFGARGAALAHVLADRTGFSVWNKKLVEAVAEETGGDERILSALDEHRQQMIRDAVRGALAGPYTNLHYLRSLMRVVHTVAAHGRAIIVGRGANYVCKPHQALRVRVVCPLNERARSYAEREGLDPRHARRIVQQMDADRADFVRRDFRRDVADPADYDLVLNSGTYSLDQLAGLVLDAYEVKVGRRPQEAAPRDRLSPPPPARGIAGASTSAGSLRTPARSK